MRVGQSLPKLLLIKDLTTKYTCFAAQPDDSNAPSKIAKLSTEVAMEVTNSAVPQENISNKKIVPRRSQRRIQMSTSSSHEQDSVPVIENIEASDTEDNPQYTYEETTALKVKAILNGKKMEEKIDNLILLLMEQGKAINELVTKVAEGCSFEESPSLNVLKSKMKLNKYKNMYIDAQKKIGDLREQNAKLSMKLEVALAKLESVWSFDLTYSYEKGQMVLSEAMKNMKDGLLMSSLTKSTEMVLGLSSSHLLHSGFAAPSFPEPNPPKTTKRKAYTARERQVAKANP
ncbi:hypothetical protein GIB67_022665 [Kingdonia uniflora]|uniref:Uncharacterized protein n=1 Tax=Kingdonia uniflora TaxID=39325 RepID=A0A7J7P8K4_9MAGN|nr:hypothetical protein GIB67_022665 [Kingdonia uniflora]